MRSPVRRLLMLGFSVIGPALGAGEKPLTADPLTAIEPMPALVKFAAAAAVPLQGIELSDAGPELPPGQSGILLMTLRKEARMEQWLIQLIADRLTATEEARPAGPDILIHTSTGRTLTFAQARTALRVECAGPFLAEAPEKTAATRTERIVVNRNFLEAGIAEYCRSGVDIARRIEVAGIKNPVFFAGSGKPAPEAVAKGRTFAEAIRLTEPEESSALSVYFSLTTFFEAAMAIPAVREVLEEVVDKPSVWSVVRQLGVRTDFHYFWTHVRAIAPGRTGIASPSYELPLQVLLNGQLGIKATLAVTAPRGPLTNSAGILAISAEHPAKPSRQLFIRVLATRAAPR